MNPKTSSFYDRLGVARNATRKILQRAYRREALRHHPDRQTGDAAAMSELNDAWFVMSDPARRAAYDQTLEPETSLQDTPPKSPRAPKLGRKAAWFDVLKLQAIRLGYEAALSASQALARRNNVQHSTYELLVEEIAESFGDRIEDRVRLARKAGATPLDLGLAAALIGLKEYCLPFLEASKDNEADPATIRTAQLLDRIWDNLAHGISRDLETALGGNPRTLRALTGRRV